jgi:hypothetical protein
MSYFRWILNSMGTRTKTPVTGPAQAHGTIVRGGGDMTEDSDEKRTDGRLFSPV